MRFLVIEEDQATSRSIKLTLGGAGLDCETATTGEEGVELAGVYDYDGIILDVTLPDLHGYEVLRRLRTAQIRTPVIILKDASQSEAPEGQRLFNVFDVVNKPFELAVLLRCVQNMFGRCVSIPPRTIKTGPLWVELAARTVKVGGRRVALADKEYSILELLSLRKDRTVSEYSILAHLHGGRDKSEPSVDVLVCQLRTKLAAAGAGASECIEEVEGLGYVLRDPEVTNGGNRGA